MNKRFPETQALKQSVQPQVQAPVDNNNAYNMKDTQDWQTLRWSRITLLNDPAATLMMDILVPPIMEEIVVGVRITPHEHGPARIAKQRVSTPVPPDKEDIEEVIQLTSHELQRMKERLFRERAKFWNSAVPADKEEIAIVRQLVAMLSGFVESRHAFA